jgi:hypothetical protein
MKIKGGTDISYRILRIAGEITHHSSHSLEIVLHALQELEHLIMKPMELSMTPATRGQFHSTVSGSDVILLIREY